MFSEGASSELSTYRDQVSWVPIGMDKKHNEGLQEALQKLAHARTQKEINYWDDQVRKYTTAMKNRALELRQLAARRREAEKTGCHDEHLKRDTNRELSMLWVE